MFLAYLAMALATGFSACHTLLRPVLVYRLSKGQDIPNKVLVYLIFMVLSSIAAPIVILPCLFDLLVPKSISLSYFNQHNFAVDPKLQLLYNIYLTEKLSI
jgi:hypothetical protein